MSLVSVPLSNLQEGRDEILERVLLNGVSNEHTRRAYRRALEKFLAWYDARGYTELSSQVLFDYRRFDNQGNNGSDGHDGMDVWGFGPWHIDDVPFAERRKGHV